MSSFAKITDFSDRYIFKPLYFKLIMVIMTLLTAIPYVQVVLGGYVKYGLAFGVLICIWTLFNGRFKEIIKNKYNWLLWGFILLYAVTTVINRDMLFTKNISQLIYMTVFLYLFVGVEGTLPAEQRKKELEIVFGVVLLFVAVFSSVGIYTFLFGISKEYQLDIYYLATHFGMYLGRLWGLYQPNTGGALASASMLITLYFLPPIRQLNKKWLRVIVYIGAVLNMILQFCYLVLSYSRGATYAFVAAIAVYSFFCIFRAEFLKEKKMFIRLIAGFAIAAALAGAVYGMTGVTRNILEYAPGAFQKLVGYEKPAEEQTAVVSFPIMTETLSATNGSAPKVIEFEVEKTELDRADTTDDLTANGRTLIWKAAIDSLKGHYLFGLTLEKAVKLTSDKLFIGLKECVDDGGMHNEYVAVFVSSGVLGFIVLGAYMLVCMFKYILSLFKAGGRPGIDFTAFCIVGFFLVSGLVEMRILYRVGIFNVLFWVCMGLIAPHSEKEVFKKTGEKQNLS